MCERKSSDYFCDHLVDGAGSMEGTPFKRVKNLKIFTKEVSTFLINSAFIFLKGVNTKK